MNEVWCSIRVAEGEAKGSDKDLSVTTEKGWS